MKSGRIITLLAIAGMIAFLVWSTLGSQHAKCEVCTDFAGQHNCASASAASRADAMRSAQATACGPIAHGMDASIACANRPPASVACTH